MFLFCLPSSRRPLFGWVLVVLLMAGPITEIEILASPPALKTKLNLRHKPPNVEIVSRWQIPLQNTITRNNTGRFPTLHLDLRTLNLGRLQNTLTRNNTRRFPTLHLDLLEFDLGKHRRIQKLARNNSLIVVSRWGRPGLRSNDWVMVGEASTRNYILSSKWQPAWVLGGNIPAQRLSGETFIVPASLLRSPYSEAFWSNAIKSIWGQRQIVLPQDSDFKIDN